MFSAKPTAIIFINQLLKLNTSHM